MPELTEADEGKPVVHGEETLGIVATVNHGTAHIEPDPGLTDKIQSQLGWAETDEETYPLQEEAVAHVTADEVILHSSL